MPAQDEALAAAFELLHNLCTANNQAAADILHGENLRAFRAIRSAAGQASGLTPLIPTKQEEERPRDPQECNIPQVLVKPAYDVNVWTIADDCEGYVFACPFFITAKIAKEEMRKVNLRYMKSLSAVAIFNMALACHLQYRVAQDCTKAEILAKRSTCLYAQAARLLRDCAIQSHESTIQVYLAICNNLVEVSLAEGHLYQARHWKHQMDTALLDACANPRQAALLDYFRNVQTIYAGSFLAARAA